MSNLQKRIVSHANNEAWLAWRQEGIGGSDMAKIRSGDSSQLLMSKIARTEIKLSSYVINQAMDGEFRARHQLIQVIKYKDLDPVCIVARVNKRFRASLDGYSPTGRILLEHKCTGSSFYNWFKDVCNNQNSIFENLNFVQKLFYDYEGTLIDHEIKLKYFIEQLIWQTGVITQTYVRKAILSVSTFKKDDKAAFMLFDLKNIHGLKVLFREVFKCQQAAALKFLKRIDKGRAEVKNGTKSNKSQSKRVRRPKHRAGGDNEDGSKELQRQQDNPSQA